MELDIGLNLENNLNNKININQNQFLNSTLGNAINNGLNIGLRYLLPDYIEEQIIELKDNILKYGLKEGVEKTIDSIIDLGKSTLGIFTGRFENISQIKKVIKNGGVLDTISDLLDIAIDKLYLNGKISNDVKRTIKNGKEDILKSIENNIENIINKQISINENLDESINRWKKKYEEKNFYEMEVEYKKIEREMKTLIPLEEKIKEIKEIEIIHNLIKNNESNFNLTEDEIEIIKKINP